MIHAPRKGSDSSKSDRRKSPRYFYPRSPQGERQGCACAKIKAYKFLSTFPARGATSSITEMVPSSLSFLPTLPARGATTRSTVSGFCIAFLSTLPARGATYKFRTYPNKFQISIHAPREGSDGESYLPTKHGTNFYPRSPRGERRGAAYGPAFYDLFLSTLPARGATPPPMRTWRPPSNFYPRSPRGERRGDQCPRRRPAHFYPRSPRGERHVPALLLIQVGDISIHAPREGSDLSEREQGIIQELFLSTLPVRGATCGPGPRLQRQPDFYPRSP